MKRRTGRTMPPWVEQRRNLALIALVAALAGSGALIRHQNPPGSSTHASGYVFDVAAWLLAIVAAVLEAKNSDLYFQIAERQARRRALVLAGLGMTAGISGCWLASVVVQSGSPALAVAGAYALLLGGIGAGLAGLFSLGWYYGGRYAARRVESLSEEEW